jgi:hypothetical protein
LIKSRAGDEVLIFMRGFFIRAVPLWLAKNAKNLSDENMLKACRLQWV